MKLNKRILGFTAIAGVTIATVVYAAAGDKYINNTNLDKDLVLSVNDGGTQTTDSFVVDGPTGSIGIGTAVPSEKLDINDNTAGKFTISAYNANATGDGIYTAIFSNSSTETALEVQTNNTANTALIVKGDGDVGIGTASPSKALEIVNSSGAYISLYENTASPTAGIFIRNSSENIHQIFNEVSPGDTYSGTVGQDLIMKTSGGGRAIHFGQGSSNIMTLDDAKVGIGTTIPLGLLELRDDTPTDLQLRLRNDDGTDGSSTFLHLILGPTANVFGGVEYVKGSSSGVAKLHFRNGATATSADRRMTIDESGNVAIGIPQPEAALHSFQLKATKQSPFQIESELSAGNVGIKKFWGHVDCSSAITIASVSGSFDSGHVDFLHVKIYSMTSDLAANSDFNVYHGVARSHSSGPTNDIAGPLAELSVDVSIGTQTLPTIAWSGNNLQLTCDDHAAVEITVVARKGNYITNEMAN
jgi:hypothetical protein